MSTQPSRIVVGIDGTDASLAALRWAFAEGGRTGSTVEVVHAWSAHSLRDMAFGSSQELANGSACMLDNEVRAAGVATDVPPPAVVQTSVHGTPTAVLTDRATGADLLVLGAHGPSDLRDRVTGTVGSAVRRHVACPVVVVDVSGTARRQDPLRAAAHSGAHT